MLDHLGVNSYTHLWNSTWHLIAAGPQQMTMGAYKQTHMTVIIQLTKHLLLECLCMVFRD